jgi:hypothetical protein
MDFRLSERAFTILKWITMVFLPAVATLYLMLADTWGLPYPQQIAATIGALVVFLGLFLEINSAQFKLRLAKMATNETLAKIRLKLTMSNGTYDVLKWITTILLPSVAILYVSLADTWGLPNSGEVAATITAIIVFLGAILQISSLEYKTSVHILSPIKHLAQMRLVQVKGFFGLNPDTYDKLKFLAQVLLPGLSTFYVALAAIWGLPLSDQISATTIAVVLFINALLQISTLKYNAEVASTMK